MNYLTNMVEKSTSWFSRKNVSKDHKRHIITIYIRDGNPKPQFGLNYQESESAISVRILIRIQNLESEKFQSSFLIFYYIIGRQILFNFTFLGMLSLSTRRNYISGF